MQELTSSQMILLIGSIIGAVIFFLGVTAAIIFFFNRAEHGDRAESEEFSDENDTALTTDGEPPTR